MKGRLIVLTSLMLAAVVSAPGAASASTNLTKNGSFETPVVPSGSFELFDTGRTFGNWTVVGAEGDVAVVSGKFTDDGIKFPAQSGSQWLDLTGDRSNSATGVSQSITTTHGTKYTMTFWVGNVYDPTGDYGITSTVDVSIDGTQVRVAKNAHRSTALEWQKFTIHFTAKSARTTLTFVNGDPSTDNSNGLDGVSLT